MKRLLSLLLFCLSAPAFAQAANPYMLPIAVSSASTLPSTPLMIGSNSTTVVEVQATGSATGLSFKAQGLPIGSSTWVDLQMVAPGSCASATSQSASGDWLVSVAGFSQFRVNVLTVTGTETFGITNSQQPSILSGCAITVQPGNTPNTVPWLTTDGRTQTTLTSASATACTSLQTTAGYLVRIINTGPATTVFATFYDEGTSPTCAAADLRYGDGTSLTFGAGQSIWLAIPLANGLAYKPSGALSSNLVIVRD